jgi:hypothetical protein
MNKVYQSAEYTLSLDEPSAAYGFPLERKCPDTPAIELRWESGTKRLIIPKPRYYQQAVVNSALAARGWVFQERVFSKRILHFTQNEVFWSCSSALPESGTHCHDGQSMVSTIWEWLKAPKLMHEPRNA